MKSLRGRIALALLAAAALPLVVTAVVQSRFSSDLLEVSSEAVLGARLEQLGAELEIIDQRYRAQAAWMARLPELQGEQEKALLRTLAAADPQVRSVSLVDRGARIRVTSDPSREGGVALQPGMVRRVITAGGIESTLEAGLVSYVAPVVAAGAPVGAVELVVALEPFTAPLRAAALEGNPSQLQDADGRIVWRSAEGPSFEGNLPRSAATRAIAGTPWTLKASVQAHAFSSRMRGALRGSLIACGLAVLLALAVQALAVRRALAPISELTRAAAAVAKGDYEARLTADGHSELTALSSSFNEMAEALAVSRQGLEDKVRERTQELEAVNLEMSARNRELGERSEELARHRYREQAKGRALAALTADAELDEVVGAALGELAGPVGAAVMVCYQLEGEELTPIATYAASEAARHTPVPLAGMAEQALRTGRIEILQGVPDGIDLRFDALIAAGRPHAVAMIPLAVGKRPSGLLMVGALSAISPEGLNTLTDLAAPLALTMARRTLLDHTERIARELARRNEELRDQASALEVQGEELKAQQAELELKNYEVQKADRLKSEFLANMSHELRTPLNAVIGFSELLIEEKTTLAEHQIQWVKDIQDSGQHLLMLINRVLDLAKIEAGRFNMTCEAVAPGEAVASACTLMKPTALKRRIAVQAVVNEVKEVKADRGRLHQVLLNLMSNAVKFSPDGAPVEVGCAPEGEGAVRFWVTDKGPGIDAESQKRLFEPFFQAESPLVKKHEGTGLGLAISKKLIQQQGGDMGVASVPGQGSTFWFTLPVAGADLATLPREEDAASVDIFQADDSPLVLVVDDHEMNLELARDLLERRGCEVILARDGEEALELARSRKPELILLDLAMPGMDGFAVAAGLKADPRTNFIPVVALTALAMRGDDERVRAAGFDGYLPKPVQRAALDSMLAKFFSKAAA